MRNPARPTDLRKSPTPAAENAVSMEDRTAPNASGSATGITACSCKAVNTQLLHQEQSRAGTCCLLRSWSGRRESNPRPTAWKAETLPLSYSRILLPASTLVRAKARTYRYCRRILELMMGLEPMTSPLPRECSTTELQDRKS